VVLVFNWSILSGLKIELVIESWVYVSIYCIFDFPWDRQVCNTDFCVRNSFPESVQEKIERFCVFAFDNLDFKGE